MIYKIEFHAMGCRMSALLETSPDKKEVLGQVPAWFEEWEAVLSRFRPESELNRINARAGLPLKISPTLFNVLRLAQKMERASSGLVTPVILPALESAGYTQSFEPGQHYNPLLPLIPQPNADLAEMDLDASHQRVTLPPGMRLDLGGVAKGWAAQQAMQRLQRYGAALVDAGGDIASSAALINHQRWPVAIRHPLDEAASLGVLWLGAAGVATSGKDFRRWKCNGIWYHHIIDPRTGQPAHTDLLTVTVVAPNVMQAEMAAKTIFILGSRSGLDWLTRRPHLAALLVFEDGSIQPTANLLPIFERQNELTKQR
jgi:FAD:protein FMN transferase